MKIEYRELELRPYPGVIRLFRRLDWLRAHYEKHTGKPYPYHDEVKGGRYVKLEGKDSGDTAWLIYARTPHVLAHELTHVLLQTWEMIGSDPKEGNGEPFCYMLSQLMLDAR